MSDTPQVIGAAVLRDYPLRLWARQEEHTQELLREFALLRSGYESGTAGASAPQQLLDLAESFTTRFGGLMAQLQDDRAAAYQSGQDRMDSRVPLVAGLPALIEDVRRVMAAVDEYCRSGDLLALARPPELVAFSEWSMRELVAQYHGAEPTPWPGPF